MSAAEKVVSLAERRAQAEEATPRKEDGFLPFPNDLMDALLAANLSARQLKLALAVIRKTLGYGKAEDDCTITQLAEVAGLHRPDASKALQQLLAMNIIRARKGHYGQLVSIARPAEWQLDPEQNTTPATTNVANHYAAPWQNATHKRQSQNTSLIPPESPPSEPAAADSPAADLTPPKPKRKPRAKGLQRTFAEWRDAMKAAGTPLVPEKDPIFEYAEEAGIPREFLRLAWIEFRTDYTGKRAAKPQIDWRAHFRDAVRRNWYKLWFLKDDGTCELTTAGLQARNAAQAADRKGAH